MKVSTMILEGCCHIGIALSCLIARNIYRMEEKSFISRMFLTYFAVDFVMGFMEKLDLQSIGSSPDLQR